MQVVIAFARIERFISTPAACMSCNSCSAATHLTGHSLPHSPTTSRQPDSSGRRQGSASSVATDTGPTTEPNAGAGGPHGHAAVGAVVVALVAVLAVVGAAVPGGCSCAEPQWEALPSPPPRTLASALTSIVALPFEMVVGAPADRRGVSSTT